MEENQNELEEQPGTKDTSFGEKYPSEDLFFGDHVKIETILGKKIRILNYVPCSGEKGKFIGTNAELIDDENKKINFSISGIVEKQIRKAEEDKNLPMLATIIQKESKESKMQYYTLS